MLDRDTQSATRPRRWMWIIAAVTLGLAPAGFVVGAVDRLLPGRTHCGEVMWRPFAINSGTFQWRPTDETTCVGAASLFRRDRAMHNVMAPVIWWTERSFIARRFDGSEVRGAELSNLRASLSAALASEGDPYRSKQVLLSDERRWRVLWPGVFKNGVGVYVALTLGLVLRGAARRLLPPDIAPGHCRWCGYDVSGCPSTRCPECGSPFAA